MALSTHAALADPPLAASRLSSRSAILQLMSAYGEQSLQVAALLRGTSVLGLGDNATRVALARLKAEGRVVVAGGARGRYSLGAAARAVHEQVAGWRDVEQRVCGWDGTSWIAAHTAGISRSDRSALARRERALRFLGLRRLRRGLFVRPRNLTGGVAAVAKRLRDLGLPDEALVVGIDELDERGAARARPRELWRDDALDERYERALAAMAQSSARLAELPLEDAARETFMVGGAAIRLIVFDPLLPEPIVDAARRRTLINAAVAYDRLGRRLWHTLLGASG